MIRFRSAVAVGAAVAVGVVVAGVLMPAGAGAQTASTGTTPTAAVHGVGSFAGIAASSPANAWAVGSTDFKVLGGGVVSQRCVIAHWNGRGWRTNVQCPSPTGDWLAGVTALSARRAWAVGATPAPYNTFSPTQPLILRWNGTRWRRVPSPTFQGQLDGVTAVSPRRAWAVGDDNEKCGNQVGAILTWNGKTWRNTPVAALPPCPLSGNSTALAAVAATSASNAWAVGSVNEGFPLIVHWNGRHWTRSQLPALPFCQPDFCTLTGVAASSSSNAWAVGVNLSQSVAESTSTPFILHWNGRAWKNVPCCQSKIFDEGLSGLNAVTAWGGRAWAVGWAQPLSLTGNAGPGQVVILKWNGHVWDQMKVVDQSADTDPMLNGVAAPSGKLAWAVGGPPSPLPVGVNTALLYTWNGKVWR
jgi:hypothetical protein